MAQVIAPEVWQEGIDDNRLLPGRYTKDIFTGSGVNIANNGEACRVWDMQISDYITDYDDRRINGLAGPDSNTEGRDGWGASAYGVFQDVRFDSRVYTMGRHRSMAWRLFKEKQYTGGIGEWGTDSTSNVETNGESLMAVAAMMSKAAKLWEAEVLGPDIDKYNLFAIMNGHISGRWVATDPDRVMEGDCARGTWVAQPGPVQGQAIPPRFAAIHAIEWNDDNIPLMLQNIKVTWNNLYIPETDRVIIIDPFYEYKLLSALTGKGVVVTDSAYADIRDGNFTRLMGWDFKFDIPTQYWPYLYFDENLNVVHSANGQAAYDKVINSIKGGDNPDLILQNQLAASDRMVRSNYIRTVWDEGEGKFKKIVTNYPLGQVAAAPYFGEAVEQSYEDYGQPTTYPWTAPGSGYGLKNPTGPQGAITRHKVIGCAVYKKAAQLSQEYSEMVQDEGKTRGKFIEMVTDVKYDAWVIENMSHGILPIIDADENTGTFAIPVEVVDNPAAKAAAQNASIINFAVDKDAVTLEVNEQTSPTVTIQGTGIYDRSYTASSSDVTVATVASDGVITGVSEGECDITYRSVGDPARTSRVHVTVEA